MLYRKIDVFTGLFLEDVFLLPEEVADKNGLLDLSTDLIAEPVPQGFHKPRWLGEEWVEGYVPTVEELLDKEIREAKLLRKELMVKGKEYLSTGVMVPFTSIDASALMQVKLGFELGITSTVIHWSNGEKSSITTNDLQPLLEWFSYERNSFFLS